MMQRITLLLLLTAFLTATCKNDAPQASKPQNPDEVVIKPESNNMEYHCTLSRQSLFGFKVGDTISVVAQKMKLNLVPEQVQTGDGTFDVYKYTAPNGESVRIYPMKKGKAECAHLLEYAGTLCRTNKDVGVGSTVEALLKAYPDLTVHGSEVEGRTVATGGGWAFLLGTNIFTPQVDMNTLNKDIRVTAILMQ